MSATMRLSEGLVGGKMVLGAIERGSILSLTAQVRYRQKPGMAEVPVVVGRNAKGEHVPKV